MYCMKCRTQLPEDVVFCSTCEIPPGSTATGTQQQQGQWEYQEVTIPFDPPFMVEMDASGIVILCGHAQLAAWGKASELRAGDWELAEPVGGLSLLEAHRISWTREREGLLRKKDYMCATSMTVKFKRWIA